MDEDVAAAAGQLFGSGPAGLLVIDARELLASTARVVGAQLGELHFKAWMPEFRSSLRLFGLDKWL